MKAIKKSKSFTANSETIVGTTEFTQKAKTWPRAELGTKQTVVLSAYFGRFLPSPTREYEAFCTFW